MLSRLKRLLNKIKGEEKPVLPFNDDLKRVAEAISKPVDLPPVQPKGRVIKQTRSVEFDPDTSQHHGRVVKVMPRQLQRIKLAQEKFEDDSDQPQVEDLED